MNPPGRLGVSFGVDTPWGIICLLIFLVFSTQAEPLEPGEVSSAEEAMRVLHANCLSCHNPEKQKGGLELTSREGLLRGGDSGVVVGGGAEGHLLLKVLAPDADPHMPPKKQLSEAQIAILAKWVAEGNPWDEAALARAGERSRVEIQLHELPPGYGPVLALALSPDGNRLAVGRGGRLLVHDLAGTNYSVVAEVNAHLDAVRSVAWSPDGELLASGSFREVRLWGKELKEEWSRTNFLGRVTALEFSPYGGALVVAEGTTGESGWVRWLDAETGKTLHDWQAHGDSIYDLGVSLDGGLLATAGHDGIVKLWEAISKREIGRLEGHTGAVYGTAFNTNASELVTVSGDGELRVWDVKSRQSVVTVGPKKHGFNAVAWSGDGATVVAGTDDGRVIRFRDFKRHTGAQSSETAQERQLAKWEVPVNAVAVNRDGSRVIAGLQDGTVYVLDGEGKELAKLEAGAPGLAAGEIPSFVHDVLPVMAKAGCMAGSCHAKAGGQNGFQLSVFSYDPASDYEEIVKEGRGRRVFPAAAEESLLLLKPTMAVEHGGGQRIEPGSEAYRLMERWIESGMIYRHPNEPTLTGIAVEPGDAVYEEGAVQELRVEAHYSDGSKRDVTSLADYESTDKELAEVDEAGQVRIGTVAGQGVIVARFMGFVDAAKIKVPVQAAMDHLEYAALPVNNFIDRLAYAHFESLGLFPSEQCTDAEFIRRSSLDAVGVLPKPEEVRAFLADRDPGKRKRWVEKLLQHPLYADYWANKWADLLRPNPDRVGVKSIYILDQWLRESFRRNLPYDDFVREILLAEGSNHRFGPAVVYRDRREPPELTTMFSQLFLGVRMECARCHHHPNEKWTQEDFYHLAAFFGPMKQKGAGLSPPISAGTETFYFAAGGQVKHPVTDEVMAPRPLDMNEPVRSEGDPRRELADWLTRPENEFFAKAAVNRVWAVFFGRGFVEPVDDFRVSNPASNEALLEALARDFADHGYDFKHLIRTILNSRLYQLSATPNEHNLADTENYSRSYRRRLPAEVLLDAVDDVTGVRDIFDGSPPGTRAIQTWSYKVDSHFMDSFGRPNSSSDCPCERDLRTSVVQSLHMMNSRDLQRKLSSGEGRVHQLAESKLTAEEITTELYLVALSRFPTEGELAVATDLFETSGTTRQHTTEDLLWALLNSAEFVFNH